MTVDPEVQQRVRRLAHEQLNVVACHQAVAQGLSRSEWRRGAGGLLLPLLRGTAYLAEGGAVPNHQQRGQSALLIAGQPGASLFGGSALRVCGVEGTPSGDREHVLLLKAGRRQRHDVQWHFRRTVPGAAQLVDGLQAETVATSLVDVSREYDDAHLLSVLDSAMRGAGLTKTERTVVRTRWPEDRVWLLDQADGRRESPLETRAALMMHLDGIRCVVPQVELQVPAFGLVRVDFLVDEDVVVECDGRRIHGPMAQQYHDRRRQEALERLGFIVVRVTWADVVYRPAETCARIRSAVLDARLRRQQVARASVLAGR